jgi:proton-dependent oligopeptide transporter, POT family
MAQFGTAEMLMYTGLGLIALGSGGIKPCVSANVGDQFTAKNGHLVAKVFDIFYFIINFGSFFASVLTPVLYKNFGPEVAFGVPGVLMFIAAFIFWLGRDKFVKQPPNPGGKLGLLDAFSSLLLLSPIFALISGFLLAGDHGEGGGDVTAYVPYIIAGALGFIGGLVMFFVRQRIQQDTGFLAVLVYNLTHQKERAGGEDYWAPARKRFGEEAAEGPPAVLKIIMVFSMVSVFWALFDQHSSTWIKQAEQMNLLLDVPTYLWDWFVGPGVIVAALYGGTALFMWVANKPLTKKHHMGFAGVMAVWFFGALAMQLSNGGWKDLGMQAAQISALNPLMVMMIIPLLTFAVYNPLEKAGRPMKPLVRMTIGMFLAAVAFLTVALLQQRIEASPPKSLHVLWQIIPYWLMTVAEVMVSVTGLAFAYTQAPRAMKSTIMGYWLLCVTFGNILVAFLAPLQKEFSLSVFFYVFAGLMAGAAVIFGIMAALYKGKTYLQEAASH